MGRVSWVWGFGGFRAHPLPQSEQAEMCKRAPGEVLSVQQLGKQAQGLGLRML